MTAAKAPAPSTYVSGFCGARRHERCRGDYRTAVCGCDCHDEPEPEPEPVVVAVHCFFHCGHVVRDENPQAAHDGMEQHYFDAHREQIRALVGWVRS